MNISENLLVQELKKGNEKAFDQLFREYYRGLCLFGTTYIKDINVVEEIVQDVYLKIWERREKLNPQTSFKTFLYTSLRNGCIDYLRKEKVKQKYSNEIKYSQQGFEEPDNLLDNKSVDYIKKAIDKLPKQRKKIFRLNRIFGLKYKEIAEKLNISPKTVENQMGIALKQLRELLKDHITILIIFINFLFNN